MKNLLLLLAGVVTLGFSGCNNDDDDDSNNVAPVESRTELLTANDWIMVAAVETQSGRSIDLFAAQPVTAQDDVFNFTDGGAVVREEGATKQDGASDIVDNGNWSFMEEERQLKVDMQTLPVNDEIVQLSKEKLVLRKINGDVETITTFLAE